MKSNKRSIFSNKEKSLKEFFNKLQNSCYYGLFKLIAKHSILPATIFTKSQVNSIDKEFRRFWGLGKKAPNLKQPTRFSTVTLGNPKSLWSYYFPSLEAISHLREYYNLCPFEALTEDGVKLCGMHFQHKDRHQNNARTLIVFGGNGDLYKLGSSAWLFKLLKKASTPFNIVMFDYRECGFSQGKANSKGLVLDGEAIYNYVHKELNVSEDHIDLCGFSLGAAIATLVKAKHPETRGALISNRSFQSLDDAVQGIFSKLGKPFSTFLSKIASMITKRSGWSLNPLEAWKAITSPKMVICHEKDPVIHYSASLEKGLIKENLLSECYHIHLKQKNISLKIRNHHVQPLSCYNDQNGHDAETKILDFLLRK
jgi:hypothetical protein